MARVALVALVACAAISAALAVVPADKISALPGWSSPLPSDQYSGYLDAGGGKHLHYWLVTSESDNAAKDPVVFWFNGGPGCSSMDGYFYEQGPFHVVEPLPASGEPKLYLNPYRWNQVANMVFLEAPACVGFSYADSPAGCHNNDTQQAIDNFHALMDFYKSYPEYAENDLFITGESYAGMYVPTLALQVINNNADGNSDIPLKGIMVGNGVIGFQAQNGLPISVDILYGHGLYSTKVYNQVNSLCGDFKDLSPECKSALGTMSSEIANVNIYDIYEPCINSGFPPQFASHYENPLNKRRRRPLTEAEEIVFSNVGGPDECIDAGAASVYLNQPSVREAIHVKSEAEIGNWTVCTSKLDYGFDIPSLLPYYKSTLIPNIKVLIYNGDVDACVPYLGNEEWTSQLGIPQKAPWRAWSLDQGNGPQVAGYFTEYEDDFGFITVKGSGHMVPQYRPPQALAMFTRFITGKPF